MAIIHPRISRLEAIPSGRFLRERDTQLASGKVLTLTTGFQVGATGRDFRRTNSTGGCFVT